MAPTSDSGSATTGGAPAGPEPAGLDAPGFVLARDAPFPDLWLDDKDYQRRNYLLGKFVSNGRGELSANKEVIAALGTRYARHILFCQLILQSTTRLSVADLRNKSSRPHWLRSTTSHHLRTFLPPFAYTCRQIYHEVLAAYITVIEFEVASLADRAWLSAFLTSAPYQDGALRVGHLYLRDWSVNIQANALFSAFCPNLTHLAIGFKLRDIYKRVYPHNPHILLLEALTSEEILEKYQEGIMYLVELVKGRHRCLEAFVVDVEIDEVTWRHSLEDPVDRIGVLWRMVGVLLGREMLVREGEGPRILLRIDGEDSVVMGRRGMRGDRSGSGDTADAL